MRRIKFSSMRNDFHFMTRVKVYTRKLGREGGGIFNRTFTKVKNLSLSFSMLIFQAYLDVHYSSNPYLVGNLAFS